MSVSLLSQASAADCAALMVDSSLRASSIRWQFGHLAQLAKDVSATAPAPSLAAQNGLSEDELAAMAARDSETAKWVAEHEASEERRAKRRAVKLVDFHDAFSICVASLEDQALISPELVQKINFTQAADVSVALAAARGSALVGYMNGLTAAFHFSRRFPRLLSLEVGLLIWMVMTNPSTVW